MTVRLNRRETLPRLLGVMLAPLGLAACASAGLCLPHAQGEAQVAAPPVRIISYDLASIDILQLLGIGVVGVPQVHMPAYLSPYGADSYPKVGSLFEPDMEALRAAKPDLIIVAGRSARQYDALRAVAPTLDLTVRTGNFLADLRRNIRTLGQLAGRDAQAEAMVGQLDADSAALHAKSVRAGTGLMLFVAGQGMSVQAPGARFGYIHELYGIQPVVTAAEAPPPMAQSAAPDGSPEAAEARRRAGEANAAFLATALGRGPDWIFVLDRPAATGGEPVALARLAASEAVRATPAWRNQRILMLDAPSWYLAGGGVQALRAAMAQFSAALG